MFGQPKEFFALAELPIDVLYIDGEIDEIELGVRNRAIIGAILLVVDVALSSFFGPCRALPGGDVHPVEVTSPGGP